MSVASAADVYIKYPDLNLLCFQAMLILTLNAPIWVKDQERNERLCGFK